jgi:hypothetical protein
MALPSIWKKVILQFRKFSVTQFWQQVLPLWPNTPPQLTLVPPPQNIKQLPRFLGMENFYCHFLPDCDRVLRPLTDVLRGSPKTLEWTATAVEGFQDAKLLLTKAVPLQHPSPKAEIL